MYSKIKTLMLRLIAEKMSEREEEINDSNLRFFIIFNALRAKKRKKGLGSLNLLRLSGSKHKTKNFLFCILFFSTSVFSPLKQRITKKNRNVPLTKSFGDVTVELKRAGEN